jgi:ABC-2 type transport system permease protein
LRTLRGTFVTSFLSQLRRYTLSGWLVTTAVSPIFLIATAWVIARLVAGGGSPDLFLRTTPYPDYLSFVALGMAFQGLASAAMETGGNAIYEEERWGTWELVAMTPFDRFTWLFAKTAAGVATALVDFAVVLGAGAILFDLHLTVSSLGAAAVGLVGTVLGLVGFAFLFAAAGIVWKEPRALAVILSPFVIFLTGMMFPLQALPEVLQVAGAFIPLTHGIRIVRDALLLGAGIGDVLVSLALLAATAVVHAVVGFLVFRRFERKAKRKGRVGKY